MCAVEQPVFNAILAATYTNVQVPRHYVTSKNKIYHVTQMACAVVQALVTAERKKKTFNGHNCHAQYNETNAMHFALNLFIYFLSK
jgi:hypothetical protein